MVKFKQTILYAFLTFLLLPFFIIASAQKNETDFTSDWKKVDQLINKGLPKSALEEVNKIYSTAKKNSNNAQVIKSLIYQLNINQNIEENSSAKNIEVVEKEITNTNEPAKSILLSISAQMYWNLFRQDRWKIYNRTNTENFIKTDVQTWSADDFHKKISELYLSSIDNEKLLQQTNLIPFDPILVKGNVRYLRPTLYDLLAHEALEYFKNDEKDISKPAYAFELKDEKAFSPVAEFVSYSFLNKDSSSLHFKALVIFQKLLKFHSADTKPDALIDADIERIEFVKQYGVMNNKDQLYINALKNISALYQNNPASAQAQYLIAAEIFNKASAEKNGSDTTKDYSLKKVKEITESIIKKFPESEGGVNAKNLLNQILHKDLSLNTEKINIPEKPFRTLVSYKNFSTIYFRIIDITPEFKKLSEQNGDEEKFWKTITSQKSLRNWKQDLPVTDDYKSHSAEVKIDGLPVGQYALLSSVSEDFDLNKNPLALQYLYVSNISFINDGSEYFILHRETGKPLSNAKVQLWDQQYDYKTNKNILQKKELLTADKNGYLNIDKKKQTEKEKIQTQNRNILLEITWQNDKLFLDDVQNTYKYYNENDENEYDVSDPKDEKDFEKDKTKFFLFTDRSIYRPGQLVYFKAIGITKDLKTQRSKLYSDKDSLTVRLSDANGQIIDSIKVLLNEFGSINGKFRLPENKLNGEFNIAVADFDNSTISFSVEEYKRPKFYAEFEKVKGTYKLNDSINIIGFAKAYAGNNIDGAKVKYRVTRVARFLYPWIFWRWPMPQSQPLEITNGEIKTDADGKFSIKFPAIPDLSIDEKTEPVFDYKIEADITDINGETRSTSATVPVGYQALALKITLPQEDAINVDSLKNIFISSTNLSGEFEPSKVNLTIYKLNSPKRLIRNRYWNQPDQFVMTKDEFLQYFPNDEYKEESKKETWEKGKKIVEISDSTTNNSTFNIQHSTFEQGWYVAEATAKDKYGKEVKDVKYFQLYDMKASSLPASAYLWTTTIKNSAEPGEKVQFLSGTSANDVFVIQQIDKTKPGQKSMPVYTFSSLNNEKKIVEFPVTEDDRGGFGIYRFFVKDNRVYTNSWNAFVPWTNKQLDITYETYRDKTLPGSEEKWKVKISGSKGEKVAAEMLATMYDASLDQFKPHSWEIPGIWPLYNGYEQWQSAQNFISVQSRQKYWNEKYIQQKEKRYDELIGSEIENEIYPTTVRYDLAGSVAGVSVMANRSDFDKVVVVGYGNKKNKQFLNSQSAPSKTVKDEELPKPSEDTIITSTDPSKIQIRKNFNETAFFFPDLKTDKDGNIEFNFTIPEALTQWKMMTLAHTKDLATGYATKNVITQKDLMVQPDVPRFLREGDRMEFSAKIVNLTNKEVTGQAELQLLNASTMNPVDGWFKNIFPAQFFTAAANQSTLVKFSIEIPANFNDAVVYRIVAKAGNNSDGEEAAIPVVTNRMLVTETMPLPVRGDGTKDFTFEKLIHSEKSESLTNYGFTVEYTTNPAWYAIQALPYLMEYPYECAEQTFNRYYANSIAAKIVHSSPKIKEIFTTWNIKDTAALVSNLQKNEELKSVLLQETPWVLQAQNEEQQKKNIALLFDIIRLDLQLEGTSEKLQDMQTANGGFAWFKGGPDDRYITQYIITGIGHLKQLKAIETTAQNGLKTITDKAIPYLDKMLKYDYDNLVKYKADLKGNNLSAIQIQYLYLRSFFPEYAVPKETEKAFTYYREQSKKYWLSQSKYMQAMIALSLKRTNDYASAKNITKSLKENSINKEEMGMYWKEWNNHGYWWYQAPVESQAMMIEAFSEIENDPKAVADMKTWLLKNKQTNNWKTTKATAEACYALLLQGTDWLSEEKNVTIKAGNIIINSKEEKQEAGTGYFKRKIDGDKVKPAMGNISVTVSTANSSATNKSLSQSASWGAVYWQYFENLDKITFSETPLKLSKKLFIEKNSDKGPILQPVNDGDEIHIGDKIKVRIELRVDRDMEYVHMKDMRAACMEPTNVISQYKYQDNLGYYETTKDVSTNFFFDHLNKGTYVFEYPMFVTHSGNFSNGITTIQCMYAPEFTAHSEGVRVNVGE